MKSQVILKRYPYEEPYLLNLEIFVSNGKFSGSTELYCYANELKEIGDALMNFPSKNDSEYRFELGSENPEDNFAMYSMLKAYTMDSLGHCSLQFKINLNNPEPFDGVSQFSIKADAASVNYLGELFAEFSKLENFEFSWFPKLS